MKLQPLSLLILSDIHFGSKAEYPVFAPEGYPLKNRSAAGDDVLKSLIATVRSSGKSLDAILVPGDLTSTATPAEFNGCVAIVSRIARELGVPDAAIFYTFGNHDADWRISKLEDENGSFKDKGYLHIAANVAQLFVKNPSPLEVGPILGTGVFDTPKFTLFVLNSGYYCTHEQTLRHGKIGPEQLRWIDGALDRHCKPEKWQIVMLHHHPFNYPYPSHWHDTSTLAEGSELVKLIGHSPVDIVFHGHRHHPTHKTAMETGWHSPVTFFCAGSVAVSVEERNRGDIPNLFHIVTLDSRTNSNAAIGEIMSFRYSSSQGWIRPTKSEFVPLDATQRFGSHADKVTIEAAAEAVIKAALELEGGLVADLPRFSELPLELQCVRHDELNLILRQVAVRVGARVCGEYPDEEQPIVKAVSYVTRK